ncbi:hypothetical protein B0H13DRAFT_1851024 [Mycena leptocephala]|nr:hypothetical protein B0H13DRAFT_1851024 [Mycena leptocephala]
MSILVNGLYTCCVSTSPLLPVTVLSSAFLHSHFPRHRSRRFALTINGGPHGSFTAELECSISSSQSVDICLGLDWKASVREWLIGLGLPPTNDFGPLQAVDPSTEGCPVTSAQVVIPSRVYPVPHTSSAPSEVAVPPMHPTLDRLKALANSLSSFPPSSLSHNSDPMLSRASLGLGLGMHTASLGTHTASVPYIPTSVSSSTSVSYPASALYSSSLVFTPDHNQNAFTTPLQGPSLSRRISGPVFPLAPSLGLNGLFLSSNPLENVLVGDIYCLHAHLATHGLSPQGKGSVYLLSYQKDGIFSVPIWLVALVGFTDLVIDT